MMWLVLVLHVHSATAQTENQNTRDSQMPRESTNSTAFLLELVELGEVCYQPHLVRARSLCVQAQSHVCCRDDARRSRGTRTSTQIVGRRRMSFPVLTIQTLQAI
jgi:hypothetical protein